MTKLRSQDNIPLVRAALIDMDGVLYDSMKYHAKAWHIMLSEIGIPISEDEFFQYEGMTGKATIELILKREKRKSISDKEAKKLYDRKTEIFKSIFSNEIIPGAKDMLDILGQHDIRRVLVTGSGQSSLLERIEKDFPGSFNTYGMVTANDVKNGKPHPEPYLKGLEKASIAATNTIVIENAPLGVIAGKAAGCFTIAVMTGPIPVSQFEAAGADLIFESMNEFVKNLPSILIKD